ncbi:MAG: cysteine synthase family protein [Candidatus Cloacimonetes bacterium]|nr:cysteine synthase family protein [Candidatus Cloacimonadota bacterium]
MDSIKAKFQALEKLVGNTPLLKIFYKYKGQKRLIYAKAESYNFTGSIKDRMALHILRNAYECGEIKQNDIICETTSGNTGISFCALGAFLGNKTVIFMPDWLSEERKKIMTLFGAELKLISRENGGFLGCLAAAEKFAQEGGVYRPLQFDNTHNVEAHYLTTAHEIDKQVAMFNQKVQACVAGVGTGGSVMGLRKYFGSAVKVHPLEPSNSPTLTTGHRVGIHRIQGISDEFIPSIVKLDQLDSVISVDDGDSIIMAQQFNSKLGLGVGISSGANFLGAVQLQNMYGADTCVATIFADDNKKYLSTALASKEPIKEGFLSSDIEIDGFEVALLPH